MEKLCISHQSWHFDFDVVVYKVLFSICTLTWRVKNYVSRRRKGKKRRNEVEEDKKFGCFPVLLTILNSIVTSFIKKTFELQLDLFLVLTTSY